MNKLSRFGDGLFVMIPDFPQRMKNPQRIRRNRERRGGFSGKSNTTNNISKWLGSIPTPTKNLS